MPYRVGDADDNASNASTILMSWVGIDTELIVDSRIVKVLTGSGVNNVEEILTGALLRQMDNADDMAAGRRPWR